MRAMTNRLPTDSQSRAMPRPRRIGLGMELEQEFTRKGGRGHSSNLTVGQLHNAK
jgi:hypothetical protein